MTAPWLSVVMPARGGAQYLPAALDSVVAERPQNIELLIFDSSPDDSCKEIVERYVDRLPISYVALPDEYGWQQKTNMGAAAAAAPHIAMLHVDDVWLPGHLNALARSIEIAPQAVMHVAPARLLDARGRDVGQWSIPFEAGVWSGDTFGKRLIVQNFVAVTTPVIRREDWLESGGIDETLWYTGDWDFYLKLADRGVVAVSDQPTTAFRIHGSSLTMSGSRRLDDFRNQMEIVLDRHGRTFGIDVDKRLGARARASIAINCALAGAATGKFKDLWPAARDFARLGATDAALYVHESRIAERILPRLRGRLSGAM